MKNLIFFLLSITALCACSSENSSEDDTTNTVNEEQISESESIVNLEWSGCYSYIEEGDETHSYYLRLDCKDSVAYGSMIHDIEAPNVKQTINGEMKGIIMDSTIYVDYTYNTNEGTFTDKEQFKMNGDKTLSRKVNTAHNGLSNQVFKIIHCDNLPKTEENQ